MREGQALQIGRGVGVVAGGHLETTSVLHLLGCRNGGKNEWAKWFRGGSGCRVQGGGGKLWYVTYL